MAAPTSGSEGPASVRYTTLWGSTLGHEDASTTLRHYAGLLPNDLEQIALKLDVHARKEATKYPVA